MNLQEENLKMSKNYNF